MALGVLASGLRAAMPLADERPDPWSPWAADARERTRLNVQLPRPEAEDWTGSFHLRQSNKGQELVGEGRIHLEYGLGLDLQVVASNRDDALEILGSQRARGGWTGRVTRGRLGWSQGGFTTWLGRDGLSREQDRLDELALSRGLPAVDQLGWAARTRSGRWTLSTTAARLLSYQRKGSFNRWLAIHELTWQPGRWLHSVAVGDMLIYTGEARALDPATLAPFTPYFLRTFDGGSSGEGSTAVADTSWRADSENNLIWLDWRTLPMSLGAWSIEAGGEILVDEFQLDSADRRRLDDVLGGLLAIDAERSGPRVTWRVGMEVLAASRWLYIHPGRETDWVDRGVWMGHVEGGDCQRIRLRAGWTRVGEAAPGRLERLELKTGRLRKGQTPLYQPWDAEATSGEPWPSGVVEARWEASLGFRLGAWRPLPAWRAGLDGGFDWQSAHNANHLEGRRRDDVGVWVRFSLRGDFAGGPL